MPLRCDISSRGTACPVTGPPVLNAADDLNPGSPRPFPEGLQVRGIFPRHEDVEMGHAKTSPLQGTSDAGAYTPSPEPTAFETPGNPDGALPQPLVRPQRGIRAGRSESTESPNRRQNAPCHRPVT